MKLTSTHKTLLLILLAAAILRLATFGGISGTDDKHYIRYAYQMAQGTYQPDPSSFYSLRFGVLIPLAFLYRLFGVGDATTIILPFCFSIGTIIVAFLLAKSLFSETAGLIAAALLATLPIDSTYATMLWPDTQMIFFISLAVLFFRHAQIRRAPMIFFAAGLCLGVAYTTKIMAIFFLPLVAIYACYALFTRKLRMTDILALSSGFLCIWSIETIYLYRATNDPLFHYHTLNAGYNSNPYSGAAYLKSHALLTRRLLFDTPFLLLGGVVYFSILFWAAIPLAIRGLRTGNHNLRMVSCWLLLLFCVFNFMPTSIARYQVLYVEPREIMMLILPGILLVAAYLADQSFSNKGAQTYGNRLRIFLLFAILAPLAAAAAKPLFFSSCAKLYALQHHMRSYHENAGLFIRLFERIILSSRCIAILALSVLAASYVPYCRAWLEKHMNGRLLCVIIILNVNLFFAMLMPALEQRNVRAIYQTLRAENDKTIYIDPVNSETLKILFGYRNDRNIRDLFAAKLPSLSNAYVIIDNDILTYLKRLSPDDVPQSIRDIEFAAPGNWDVRTTINAQSPLKAVRIYWVKNAS
jgi:hypothetical protein